MRFRDGERVGGTSRVVALIAALALFVTLPITALAHASEPVTVGDWMRQIFVTPDREIDPSQKGLAAAVPVTPPPAIDTSSQPIPKEPQARPQVSRFFLPREFWRRRARKVDPTWS
ncbi:MAG TPA: hypothetical protein VGG33_26575 [Polyangia bacterium]